MEQIPTNLVNPLFRSQTAYSDFQRIHLAGEVTKSFCDAEKDYSENRGCRESVSVMPR